MSDLIEGPGEVIAEYWVWPLRYGETLSNHDWMELHIHRLLGSRLISHAIAEGRREDIATALILWAESMRQDPAGTLPDDEVELAMLARYGADLEGWRRARKWALHGWRPVIVSGGNGAERTEARLGHPFIEPIVARMFRRASGRSQAREAARVATSKSRVRKKLCEMGRKNVAAQDVIVSQLAQWLDERNLFITGDNVVLALDAVGVPKVVGRIGSGVS